MLIGSVEYGNKFTQRVLKSLSSDWYVVTLSYVSIV